MTNRTVTARSATYAGTIAGITFSAGTATADDATASGLALIEFAKRQGWAVSGGIATATTKTVAQGKPVSTWTVAELKAYLDGWHVQYPSGALKPDLLAAALDAFETKAQGGAAPQGSGGHVQGSHPPEGAPPVPGDDETKAAQWITPLTTNVTDDVAPAITGQPSNDSAVAPAAASFTIVVTGTPTPDVQWQIQAGGTGDWVDIDGATGLTLEIDPTEVGMNGDKFRAVVANTDGTVTSSEATLTVTAA